MTVTLSHTPDLQFADAGERGLLGRKVGDIRVVELLGTGGMGAAYLEHDEQGE